MKPTNNKIADIQGFILQPYSLLTVLNNFINVFMGANLRPTMTSPFDIHLVREWRGVATTMAGSNELERIARALSSGDERSLNALEIYLKDFAKVAAALVAPPVYIDSVGRDLHEQFAKLKYFDRQYVAAPSLGYARPYYQLNISDDVVTGVLGPFTTPAWRQMDANGEAVKGSLTLRDFCADLCMLADRARFTKDLLPDKAPKATGGSQIQMHWANTRVHVDRADQLVGAGLLYERQADRFWLELTRPYRDFVHGLAVAVFPREAERFERVRETVQKVMSAIPLHPILGQLAASLQQAQIATDFGDHDAVLVPDALMGGLDVPDELGDLAAVATALHPSGGPSSSLASVYYVQMLIEYTRLHQGPTDRRAWADRIANEVSAIIKPSEVDRLMRLSSDSRNVAELLTWLARNHRYVEKWGDIASRLGWGGVSGAAAVTLNASGADYVLTNGIKFSADPVAPWLGLRPTLSLGNFKASGTGAIRCANDFNTGPIISKLPVGESGTLSVGTPVAIEWSTVPVHGYVDALIDGETLTTLYITTGMSMGEDIGEPVYLSNDIRNHIARAVAEFYNRESPAGYVSQLYRDPVELNSVVTPSYTTMRTSWDFWAVSREKDVAQRQLLEGYGARSRDVTPLGFLLKAEGNARWASRFPVAMARTPYYVWVTSMGHPRWKMPYQGYVQYDGIIELTGPDTHFIKKWLDLMPHVDPEIVATEDEVLV